MDLLKRTEVEKLLDQPNPRYFTGQRNKLIINCLLYLGLKLNELTELKWDDFGFNCHEVFINNGRTLRILSCPSALADELNLWHARQKKRIGKQEQVFTTLKGTKVLHRYIQGMLRRYSNKADIRHTTPGTLRKTAIVGSLMDGRNVIEIMQYFGLSDYAGLGHFIADLGVAISEFSDKEIFKLDNLNISDYSKIKKSKAHACKALKYDNSQEEYQQCSNVARQQITLDSGDAVRLCWIHSVMQRSGWYLSLSHEEDGIKFYKFDRSAQYGD